MPFFQGWAVAGMRGNTAGSPPPQALDSLAPGRPLQDAGMHGAWLEAQARGEGAALPAWGTSPPCWQVRAPLDWDLACRAGQDPITQLPSGPWHPEISAGSQLEEDSGCGEAEAQELLLAGLDDEWGSQGNSIPLPGTDATLFLPASPHGTGTASGSKRANPGGCSPQPRKKQRGEAQPGTAQLLGLPGGGALLAPPVLPPLPLPAWPGPHQPAWPVRSRLVPHGHLALLLPIQLPSPPCQRQQAPAALLPPQHPSARPDSPSALLNTCLLLRALRWSLTTTALA
ncbi:proline-rich protein 12-like [Alligator mississippiensis]|uniref:proline-rich protein 12-like n=1 Tax=Alligator mississippiensis TaxID=8496 RepID=UPI002877858B|nr:proline-rich protein 12-like [Alligator mississippiensis]